MYQLLVVEDDPEIVKAIKEALVESFEGMEVTSCGFGDATVCLRARRPDFVILDLAQGAFDIDAARPTWDYVWKTHFCPLLIFSAHEPTDYELPDHPFTGYERKGANGIANVVSRIKGFVDHAAGIRDLRNEIDDRIAEALCAVSPLVWRDGIEVSRKKELLRRITRRRVAASLDSPVSQADGVKALEQFVFPAIESSLLTGDVIKDVAEPVAPSSFRVVLTPSCDLVSGEGRYPVSGVLVAACIAVDDGEVVRRCNLEQSRPEKLAVQLGKKLKEDRVLGLWALPALDNVWPAMVVDLKRVDIVQRSDIGLSPDCTEGVRFIRLASLDSPFRESLTWRFLETTGRPGLPDLDRKTLEQDIMKAAGSAPKVK